MPTYYNWQSFVIDNVKTNLAADTSIAAWDGVTDARNPASVQPPEIPDDLETADSPIILVSRGGQLADEMLSSGEYGLPVVVNVQVIVSSPFTHSQATGADPGDAGGQRTLGYCVSEVQRVLRDQMCLAYVDQADVTITRQCIVALTGVTPISKHETDPTWIQQTVSAVFTVIGD